MANQQIRVYADTSVFGGVFDPEFSAPSGSFFAEVDAGRFTLVISSVIEEELDQASEEIRSFFANYADSAQRVEISQEATDLQLQYMELGVVAERSLAAALHVAMATVSGCELFTSWKFRDIVHFKKAPKNNAVNMLHGYRPIGIHAPTTLSGANLPEPECVAIKRRGQERVRRLVAGMSRQEELEFWRERTEKLRAWQEAKRGRIHATRSSNVLDARGQVCRKRLVGPRM